MIDVPVQVKDALRDGRLKKNFRFVVLNEDGTESEIGTIDNNNIVSESVSIDERMCSGDTLKFGLCEGSSLEFQYFDKPSIAGKRVQAFIDVDYGEDEPYTIPMGFFDVKKCSRQASTGIIKVTAYNKLQSDYLDAKANDEIIDIVAQGEAGEDDVSIYYVLNQLLQDYNIENYDISSIADDIPQEYLDNDTLFINYWMPYHNVSIDEIQFPLFDSSGNFLQKYLHIATASMDLGQLQGHYPDPVEYYYMRGLFNADAARYIMNTFYLRYGALLDTNCVMNDNTSETMTLRDFIVNEGCYDFLAQYTRQGVYMHDLKIQNQSINGHIGTGHIGTFSSEKYLTSLASDYMTDITYITLNSNIFFTIPYRVAISNNTNSISSTSDFVTRFKQIHGEIGWYFKTIYMDIPEMALQRITEAQAEALSDVTLRELQSAVYETVCQFGQLSRLTDLFSGVELNRLALYPADTLYPDNALYPDGAQASSFRSQYSKLWADEGNVHKWRNLIITYKGLDENQQPKDFTLQRQVNADGTDDYNCSDNWLFRNLVWTSEQIAQYADVMVAKMQPITWFPFEMWAAGLPYLETGDQIEIPLGEETYTSYILQRNLKGIQNLQDTYINGTLDIF